MNKNLSPKPSWSSPISFPMGPLWNCEERWQPRFARVPFTWGSLGFFKPKLTWLEGSAAPYRKVQHFLGPLLWGATWRVLSTSVLSDPVPMQPRL